MSHLDQAAAPATVDKTPEQREAERQQKLRTEKLAGWAEQVAKLAKADPSQCQTSVYRNGDWHGRSCSKTAKYHREESLQTYPVDAEAPIVTRHYCATHDPILKKEREDKKRESEKAQYDLRRKRENEQAVYADAQRKRLLLLSKLADGLSTESIERIATAMPHILAEAVNELDGKVEYVDGNQIVRLPS